MILQESANGSDPPHCFTVDISLELDPVLFTKNLLTGIVNLLLGFYPGNSD